jgi:hypothetical protein
MRINQSKPLRWFFAELLVIVLGISIAFQVDDWQQRREDKALEIKALHEVLGDLDTMESSVSDAMSEYGVYVKRAVQLVTLIQARNSDESKYLDSLSLGVYLIGESDTQYAYEGMLDSGRFANVDDPELTTRMRIFFTLRQPWIYATNVRHIALWDELMEELYRDIKRVPDKDFQSTEKSHLEISVPLDQFPTSPTAVSGLLEYINSTKNMINKFKLILQDIEDTRQHIAEYLKKQSSA